MAIVPIITIDGPSGSGKSSLCKALAKHLGWHFLDSGIIYRILAVSALYKQVDITSEEALISLAKCLDSIFFGNDGAPRITLEGKDLSNNIHTEIVGDIASQIAMLPRVRKALIPYQRVFLKDPGLVTDGRDMGTVVFPDAQVKIFLDANPKERAKRRRLQLQGKGLNVHFKQILCEIQERDARDRNRVISPLIPAPGSFFLDSTSFSSGEVIGKALRYTQKVISTPLATRIVNR